MGVLNLTPDSFSDGGLHFNPENALERAGRMLEEGADIIDVGGESTRPGSEPVPLATERDRVLPVIEAIRETYPDLPLSVDTSKAEVAEAAIKRGADIINDVWGCKQGLDDTEMDAWRASVRCGREGRDLPPPAMAVAAARRDCPIVLMHNRRKPEYEDFWPDLLLDLRVSIAMARRAGTAAHQIWLDPGFGFGKTPAHNLEVLKHLDRIDALGFPVLLGTSRKSTIGLVMDRPVHQRLEGTAATLVWGIAKGCSMARVHDVAAMRLYTTMADAIRRGIEWPLPDNGQPTAPSLKPDP